MPLLAPTQASVRRATVVQESISVRRQSEACAQRKSIIASPPSHGIVSAQASSRFDALVLEWVNQTSHLPAFDSLDILTKVSSALEIKADIFGAPAEAPMSVAVSPTSPKSMGSSSMISGAPRRSPSPGTSMGSASIRVKQVRQQQATRGPSTASTTSKAAKVESPDDKRKRVLAEVRVQVNERMEELEVEAQEEYECRMRGQTYERKQKAPKRRRVVVEDANSKSVHVDPVPVLAEEPVATTSSTAQPVVEEATEETAEPVVEDAAEETAEPVAEEAAEETAEPVVEEATEETAEPVVEEAAEETAEPVVEEAIEKTAEPVAKETTQAAETAEPVVEETAANPAAEEW